MSMSGVAAALPQQPLGAHSGGELAGNSGQQGGLNGDKGSTRSREQSREKGQSQGSKVGQQQQVRKEEPRKVRFSVGTKYAASFPFSLSLYLPS
jgi:hypothetical protein